MTSGLKIVQTGTDVRKATSYETVASSEFPTLRIIDEGAIDVPVASSGHLTIVRHDLGYAPLFFVMEFDSENRASFRTAGASVDSEVFYFETSQIFRGYYLITDYDITSTMDSEFHVSGSPSESRARNKSGIKSTKSDKDMQSADLRDYNLNTEAHTLSVHQNTIIDIPNSVSSYSLHHGLGYLPSYIALARINPSLLYKKYRYTYPAIQIDANSLDITFRATQFALIGTFYNIILKEPFNIK